MIWNTTNCVVKTSPQCELTKWWSTTSSLSLTKCYGSYWIQEFICTITIELITPNHANVVNWVSITLTSMERNQSYFQLSASKHLCYQLWKGASNYFFYPTQLPQKQRTLNLSIVDLHVPAMVPQGTCIKCSHLGTHHFLSLNFNAYHLVWVRSLNLVDDTTLLSKLHDGCTSNEKGCNQKTFTI